MRIGFATLYSWRPHVEHLYFLAELARRGGHDAYFLTCDSDLKNCYSRELRGRSAWRECGQCRLAGVRSFTTRNVQSIGRAFEERPPPPQARDWTLSSASTLGRFESDEDYASPAFERLVHRLLPSVERTYSAARSWMQRTRLEAVCVFNGRMDVTRAVFEAARSLGIRVVTLERTWFGDGLQLYPDETCLGLRTVDRLVADWGDKPLTEDQALGGAAKVARRFLRSNTTEWRAYNVNAVEKRWPVGGAQRRILLIPSSRNEVWGHPDWNPQWKEPTEAYDALMAHFGLQAEDVVLRCHPNWSERIGSADGHRSQDYYQAWALRRGVHVIASADNTSTLGLIEQCDAIVVAHGSAALEAGLLGKQVFATAPSFYQAAGFRDDATSPERVRTLRLRSALRPSEQASRAEVVSRQTLRFCYTMAYRVPQYTRFVKAAATTRYVYDDQADPDRFIDLLRSGIVQPDDATSAGDDAGERKVLSLVSRREWGLICGPESDDLSPYRPLRRRWLMRPVDLAARWKPVGDR